jgi:hypothetical protein
LCENYEGTSNEFCGTQRREIFSVDGQISFLKYAGKRTGDALARDCYSVLRIKRKHHDFNLLAVIEVAVNVFCRIFNARPLRKALVVIKIFQHGGI